MKITMDLYGGSPYDGQVTLEEEIDSSRRYNLMELIVIIAGASTGYRYNVRHHFLVPSSGWIDRTVVRPPTMPGAPASYEYMIVERLEEGDTLLLTVKYLGQKPDRTHATH
jgi:hypothetical protein